MQAAVAGAVRRAEYGELAFEPVHARMHIRLPLEHTGIVHEVARRERVGAVEDQVVVGDDPSGVVACERGAPGLDPYIWIERLDPHAGGVDLRRAEGARVVDDLALQVVDGDGVVVEDPESPDPCGRKIEGGR